jgi:membrane associated rhomboid family serine protease
MGLYDREYYRTEPQGGGLMGGVAPVCKWLIAINAGVFVLQVLTLNSPHGGATGWFALDPRSVVEGWEFWRLLTYAFTHDPDNPFHVLFNMWFLWMCGSQIEPIYGPREFLRFYLAASVFTGLCHLAFAFVVHSLAPCIGASGAVLAVTMICAMYYPTQKVLLLFVIPVEMRWLVVLCAIFDAYPLLRELGGAGMRDQVAHAAHLGGLFYGFVYKWYDLRWSRILPAVAWPRIRQVVRNRTSGRSSKVRLYEPPDERRNQADLERRVDEILAKISAEGEASLTEAERQVLKEASRRYKKR